MEERPESRTVTLIGEAAYRRLRESRVLVVGVGGVGGYALESIARSGIGYLRIVDADSVGVSNLNRQIIALQSTVGKSKVAEFKQRIADIDPEITVEAHEEFLTPENLSPFLEGIDMVIDAIDTVTPKVALIAECQRKKLPIISAMGAGGRIDPSKVCYQDLWSTRDDGLARAVRQRLKKMGLRLPLHVVASTELPAKGAIVEEEGKRNKRTSPGTLSFVPAAFGLLLGAAVIKKLIEKC